VALAFERMTADQFLALADQLPRFTQLIDGEVVVCALSLRHQRVVLEIAIQLRDWVRGGAGRGEVGISPNVVLDDRNVYSPDVWWCSEERKPPADAERIVGPPDLAVEVRSPSTWRYDIHRKKTVYERLGLPELWLVDTDAGVVLAFRRSAPDAPELDVAVELSAAAGDALTSPLLPDFALDLRALFAR
jgi:Uma2 family endonuclease